MLPKFMANFRKEAGCEPSDLPDSSIFPHTFSIEYFEAACPEHLVSNQLKRNLFHLLGHFGSLILQACVSSKACQFSGVEHIRLVSLLVTFAAIWAWSYGCPAQLSRTGPLPACADASFGLHGCDSRHLLVICRFSGVRIFRGLILWHP